jgi:hypothetical protein
MDDKTLAWFGNATGIVFFTCLSVCMATVTYMFVNYVLFRTLYW